MCNDGPAYLLHLKLLHVPSLGSIMLKYLWNRNLPLSPED